MPQPPLLPPALSRRAFIWAHGAAVLLGSMHPTPQQGAECPLFSHGSHCQPHDLSQQLPTRILNKYTLNLLIWTKIRRKSTFVNSSGCILLFLNYLTLRNCSAARTDLGEYNIKSSERTILAFCTNSTFGWGQSRLLLSLCLIVCLFVSCSCSRTKASASILPQSKNFPTCPLHCGCQPTNQRHAASRQRGFDANLQTSNNHYWWFACLPGTV